MVALEVQVLVEVKLVEFRIVKFQVGQAVLLVFIVIVDVVKVYDLLLLLFGLFWTSLLLVHRKSFVCMSLRYLVTRQHKRLLPDKAKVIILIEESMLILLLHDD